MGKLEERLAGRGVDQGSLPVQGMIRQVVGVTETGTVLVDMGIAVEVACLDSYGPRTNGDLVFVIKTSAGSWLVMGKVGPGPLDPSPGLAVAVTGRRSWRSDVIDPDRVIQGRDSVGAWRGGWFYNGGIKTATDTGVVTGIDLRLTRGSAATGGPNGKVTVRVWLHNELVPPASLVTMVYGPFTAGSLAFDESVTVSLPAAARAMLVAGTAKGFVVGAADEDQFMVFGGASGAVNVKFT